MKFAGDRFGWVYRYAVNFSAAGVLGTLWVELWVDFWGASSVLVVLVIAVVSKLGGLGDKIDKMHGQTESGI
jgi:hypothetical protein